VYSPVLEMVPFEAPPATLQVTAVFDVPVTLAVNCCVLPTATLTVEGETETATEVLGGDVLAQPSNKTQTQLRPLKNDAHRMKILTEGQGPHFKNRNQKVDNTESIYPWNWTT
jgi:hypothetical protein